MNNCTGKKNWASPKTIGNAFEGKLLDFLRLKGYWCHLFSYNKNGQPCDVIAIRNDKSMLLDVKHCDGDLFYTSRIEPNQHTCFKYASSFGNKNLGFAIWFESDQRFRYLPYSQYCGQKTIHKSEMYFLEEII